ncbi:MAG: hypothetical protein E4H44_06730 [Candidatus Aminicenantes bacterium]|nr:MAG: hypothetical protein E4H44_06730 [Candidatus Aminicenantes bacterium]
MAVPGFRHFGLKVVSVALAALLWLLVSGERIAERAMRIPLEFANLPAYLEVIDDPPIAVDVRVRGTSGALSRIAAGELVAILDLQTARSGRRLFSLTGSEVRTPFGVEVVQVTPSSLSLTFEQSASKIVPVLPAVEGEPLDGFVVGTVTVVPPMVEVIGPVSALASLTEAITEPVSVTGASGPLVESVTVGVAVPLVRLRQPQSARVTVNVGPAPVEWAVAAVPVRILNPGSAPPQVSPTEVTIHVRGPLDTRGSGADAFEASIDVAGLRRGQYDLPVLVEPPQRIGVVRVDPPEVRVRIR